MGLRSVLDDLAPQFEKGGKYSGYPAYEAIDTALYTLAKPRRAVLMFVTTST